MASKFFKAFNFFKGKGKVSPTIKSVKPSVTVRKKGVKASLEKTRSDEYRKRLIMPSLYGFQKKELLRVYENMILSRLLDEKMAILLRQGKGFFHMACSGHEAAQIAAAFNFKSAKDWFYPYYRDSAFTIGLGMSAKDHLLAFFAKSDDHQAALSVGIPLSTIWVYVWSTAGGTYLCICCWRTASAR